MQKILIAGASGAAGFEVLKILAGRKLPVRALVRSEKSVGKVKAFTNDIIRADALSRDDLRDAFVGVDLVFSALGKSVSLFSNSEDSFERDYEANKNLLLEAMAAGCKRFVYLSIKSRRNEADLMIPKVHRKVEELIRKSGLNFTFIRPVGFFSGLNDLIILGKKGIVPVPSSGKNLTNSIHHYDLAEVIADNIYEGPEILEVGGPETHSRNNIARMVSKKTKARVVHLPLAMVDPSLFALKFFSNSTMAKLDYFKFVTTNDMVASAYGKIKFSQYLAQLDLDKLP